MLCPAGSSFENRQMPCIIPRFRQSVLAKSIMSPRYQGVGYHLYVLLRLPVIRSAAKKLCQIYASQIESSPPMYMKETRFREIQRQMSMIPRKDWCFARMLRDKEQRSPEWIHRLSFAKNFTLDDFVNFERLWRHTSDGADRLNCLDGVITFPI